MSMLLAIHVRFQNSATAWSSLISSCRHRAVTEIMPCMLVIVFIFAVISMTSGSKVIHTKFYFVFNKHCVRSLTAASGERAG
jgi:SNF family Na+-dependent transporter